METEAVGIGCYSWIGVKANLLTIKLREMTGRFLTDTGLALADAIIKKKVWKIIWGLKFNPFWTGEQTFKIPDSK